MSKNFIDEAKRLLKLIDTRRIIKKEDYLFVESIRNRVRYESPISEKQIFWLRDIKDRILEEERD